MRSERVRGMKPINRATRARILRSLLIRADAGDVAAAEALVRLSIEQDRVKQTSPDSADHAEQAAA